MSEEQNRILKQQLWNIANELRGNMGADEFRDYILHENTAAGQSYIAALEEASVEELGYFLKPSETFHAIAMKGSNQLDTQGTGDSHNFILGDLTKILKNIEQSCQSALKSIHLTASNNVQQLKGISKNCTNIT
jgi:type I restriction enzyme M protein